MSKSHNVTIHRVFEVYQNIFDHIDDQREKLSNKRMRWKMDIRFALDKSLDKAKAYYGKTENPRGLLLSLATCLNPYQKLELYKEWDEEEGNGPNDPGSYTATYRRQFIAHYEKHYAPPEERSTLPTRQGLPIPRRMGVRGRSKQPLPSDGSMPTSEAIQYIDSPVEPEPPEPVSKSRCHDHDKPQGRFYESDLLGYWRFTSGRLPNLARMARDILAVPANGVGVERVFNTARDLLPYRRNRMNAVTIQASMVVKHYQRAELTAMVQAEDSDKSSEAMYWEKQAVHADLEHFLEKQEASSGVVYISDDDEDTKQDTDWSFVDDNGERAFDREPVSNLPPKTVKSAYVTGNSGPEPGGGEDAGSMPSEKEMEDDWVGSRLDSDFCNEEEEAEEDGETETETEAEEEEEEEEEAGGEKTVEDNGNEDARLARPGELDKDKTAVGYVPTTIVFNF